MGSIEPASTTPNEPANSGEELPESEVLFRRLAHTTSAAIFIVQDLNIRYVNPAATFVTGFTRQDLLGMQIWQIGHPAYQDLLKQRAFRNQWSKDLPLRFELKIITKSSQERWLDITAGEIEFQGGPAWLLTAFDITERDLAEQALRKARDELEIRVQERTSELQQANQELVELQLAAERAAREAQRQANELEIIIRSMADAVVVYDSGGILVRVNAAALKTFGFDPTGSTRAEIIDRLGVRYEDGKPLTLDEIPSARSGRGEQINNLRLDITNALGKELKIIASTSPLIDHQGQLFGSLAVWHDVTERERLLGEVEEQRLRAEDLARYIQAERDILHGIMENTQTHLAYLDTEFRFVLVNSAYCLGSGYSAEELIGRKHFDLFPHAENQAIFEHVRSSGKAVEFLAKPFEFPDHPERGITYWDWTLVPVKDEQGNVRGFVFSLVDVTEKIRSSQDRERLLAELNSERGLLRAVIHNAPEAVILADNQARMLLANPAALQLFQQDLPIGEDYSAHARLNICYPDGGYYQPRHLPLTRSALDGENHTDVELVILHPDGQKRYLLSNTAPIRDCENQVTAAVGIIRDITNRKSAEEQLRETAKQLDALQQATAALFATLELEPLLNHILDAAINAIPSASRGALYLIDGETNRLSLRALSGQMSVTEETMLNSVGMRLGNQVLHTRQPTMYNQVEWVQDTPREEINDQEPGLGSMILAPLVLEVDILGVLALISNQPDEFNQADLQLLTSFATTTTTAIHNATLHSQVRTLALTDALTGLFNRRGFNELGRREVERARRFKHPLAALLLDIDHFKTVNDTFSHAAGDQVLKALAERLSGNLREVDIIGRYGGEEYAILLPETDVQTAVEIAERLRACVEESPFDTRNGPLDITISLGVSRFSASTPDLDSLLHSADLALYAAKLHGRNRVEVN